MPHLHITYTDTFANEPNYSWVRRTIIPVSAHSPVMRRAKAVMGLTSVRGTTSVTGDTWEFRPYRTATVLFATYDPE